ncbi:unnamed protein product [Gongylonema pulchrum]|uniref:Uncharacterized protein n=1 Tax=Gongylonema pulchrum TaxID=637853 RepID=A0A183EEY2_9BILA|nr:unnamed protein product [Gongylonema pulchrum]
MPCQFDLREVHAFQSRVATDEELKLSDTLRYYMKDTDAAKDLLYRRMRCLANYEAANKNLERCRGRNKDIPRVLNLLVFFIGLDYLTFCQDRLNYWCGILAVT